METYCVHKIAYTKYEQTNTRSQLIAKSYCITMCVECVT